MYANTGQGNLLRDQRFFNLQSDRAIGFLKVESTGPMVISMWDFNGAGIFQTFPVKISLKPYHLTWLKLVRLTPSGGVMAHDADHVLNCWKSLKSIKPVFWSRAGPGSDFPLTQCYGTGKRNTGLVCRKSVPFNDIEIVTNRGTFWHISSISEKYSPWLQLYCPATWP